MSSCRSAALLVLGALAAVTADAQQRAADRYTGIGRRATAAEVSAWDIDVRPDFKGLPAGRGSVKQGQAVWEAQCAGCHGIFGESNEVFPPLVGGTTKQDIETGRVARLDDASYPGRTTLMKLSQVSTLWDYIRRAMPWTAPKTLSAEEVYAVTAYLLHLGDVVAADFELSDRNMREVQAHLPNRKGLTTGHALWPGAELGAAENKGDKRRNPDVQGSACMAGCAVEPTVASMLPDHARNAHGNLSTQQREVGPQRGAATEAGLAPPSAEALAAAQATPVRDLLQKNVCLACHQLEGKLVGPSFKDVASRHAARADAQAYLAERIKGGSMGQWGTVPMPPQALSAVDAQAIAGWLATGAKP
ncbi:MAG TPA: c-type cytochrome [Burkholderiaceae bacterium]